MTGFIESVFEPEVQQLTTMEEIESWVQTLERITQRKVLPAHSGVNWLIGCQRVETIKTTFFGGSCIPLTYDLLSLISRKLHDTLERNKHIFGKVQ